MPIEFEGLSDQTSMSLAGHLRLGKEMEEGQEHPEKTPFFRLDPEDANVLPTLHEIFGPAPTRLRVMFLADELEDIFPQYLMKFGAAKRKKGQKLKERTSFLVCKGTGGLDRDGNPKPAICRLVDAETGEMAYDHPCDPATCSDFQSGRCKRVAFLSGFILTDFPTLRTWQVNTSGKGSIRNLNTRIRGLQDLARAGGRGSIAGLPLILSLKPKQSRKYDKRTGKPLRGKWTYYVMDLDIDTQSLMAPSPALTTLHKMMLTGSLRPTPPDIDISGDGFFPRSQITGADVVAERLAIAEAERADDEVDPVLANLPDDIADGMRAIGLTVKQVRNLVLRYLEPGQTVLTTTKRDQLFKYLNTLADLKVSGDEASFSANIAGLNMDVEEADDAEMVEEEREPAAEEASQTEMMEGDPLGLGDI